MSKYLLLFTISPVQSFIAQARKTHDLYAGSSLLSETVKVAIQKTRDDYNGKIIFPCDENSTVNSKPNRFVAIVETNQAASLGKSLKDAVESAFEAKAEDIFEKVCGKENKPHDFYQQLETFWQIYWVILPCDTSISSEYNDMYSQLEMFMGGVKNLRAFKQLAEPPGRKCSLCGERNALFYNPRLNLKTGKEIKPRYILPEALKIKNPRVGTGEGLCAICMTKRFWYVDGQKKEDFPSTAGIALMSIIDGLKDKGRELLEEYRTTVNNSCATRYNWNVFDYELLYEENINPDYFKKNGLAQGILIADKGQEEINLLIRQKHRELVNFIKNKERTEASKQELPKYYALVLFDGDSMGEWLSGNRIDKDKISLEDFHSKLSERLTFFAGEVLSCFQGSQEKEFSGRAETEDAKEKKWLGRVVYAGGEDFLGFVTLQDVLPVLKHLREKFEQQVSNELKEYFLDNQNCMSFSAGLVIAHYKTPLSEVLKWGRKLEKEAKEIDEHKNALAIAVLKHSGEINRSIYKWRSDKKEWVTDAIDDIVKALNEDRFSDNFVQSLDKEFRRIMDENGKLQFSKKELSLKIVEAEIKRLVKRSCKLNREEKEQEIPLMTNTLNNLYKESFSMENFLSVLRIVKFMAKEV